MATWGLGFAVLQGSVLVFLPDELFHARILFVDIGGHRRLDVLRVEDLVHERIAVGFHILENIPQLASCLFSLPLSWIQDFTHINLIRRPTVHTQRFDLGDMGAQFPMQRGAPHAQENAHLQSVRQCLSVFEGGATGSIDTYIPTCPT